MAVKSASAVHDCMYHGGEHAGFEGLIDANFALRGDDRNLGCLWGFFKDGTRLAGGIHAARQVGLAHTRRPTVGTGVATASHLAYIRAITANTMNVAIPR